MKISYSAVCDTGICRQENQDSVFLKCGADWGIFVVADGMGGHADGALASEIITGVFADWVNKVHLEIAEYKMEFLFSQLRRLLGEANEKILCKTEVGTLCGSTAVVLLLVRDFYVLLSVGDSRCYELQKKLLKSVLVQLTRDEVCDIPGAKYGKLTNAVGTRTPLRCNIVSGKIKKDHFFLLCTDGVYKHCNDKELTEIVKRTRSLKLDTVSREIKNLVYQRGAQDNLSAIAVSVSQ